MDDEPIIQEGLVRMGEQPAPRRWVLPREIPVIAVALLLMTAYILWRYEGQPRAYRLNYFLPAVVMGVLFLFDRLPRAAWLGGGLLTLDLLMTGAALYRTINPVFFYSGHALFLTYALLTVRSRACFAVALLVLLQTMWLKLVVWPFDLSLPGGLVIGSFVGLGHRMVLYWREGVL